jgi:hypothetical protein
LLLSRLCHHFGRSPLTRTRSALLQVAQCPAPHCRCSALAGRLPPRSSSARAGRASREPWLRICCRQRPEDGLVPWRWLLQWHGRHRGVQRMSRLQQHAAELGAPGKRCSHLF